MKLYAIGLVGMIDSTEVTAVVLTDFFRPTKLYTDVTRPGLVTINNIWFGNQLNGCLIGPIDAWEFSTHLVHERRVEFFKAHQLDDKPEDFIDDYLDENGLSLPDVPPLHAPTLIKDAKIRLQGRFNTRCGCSIFGYTR